jgi:Right handed beta helix region
MRSASPIPQLNMSRNRYRLLCCGAVASAAIAQLALTGGEAAGNTVRVAAGADLQQALTNARPGDVIVLDQRAMFTGNFTLPQKDGNDFITIRTAGATDTEAIGRVTTAEGFATLRSPNGAPVLQTAPGAHHWRVQLVELTGSGNGNLVVLGSDSQTSLAQVPHDLVIDRAYIHGDAATGVKRCIALNSGSTVISNSYISDCKAIGEDAQAIAGWNGPGPFTIINNYVEGSSENILFGGADPTIPNLVPSDIAIRGNQISKPVAWRNERWQVKNLLELKNARRVTIDRNVLEYNWLAAQQGFAVLFTVRNQDGRCGWCQLEEVTFTNNVLQHSGAGFQILGRDDEHPSQQTRNVTIRNNVLSDIDPRAWGGAAGYHDRSQYVRAGERIGRHSSGWSAHSELRLHQQPGAGRRVRDYRNGPRPGQRFDFRVLSRVAHRRQRHSRRGLLALSAAQPVSLCRRFPEAIRVIQRGRLQPGSGQRICPRRDRRQRHRGDDDSYPEAADRRTEGAAAPTQIDWNRRRHEAASCGRALFRTPRRASSER